MPELSLTNVLERWLRVFDSLNIVIRNQLNPPATDQQVAEAEEQIGVAFPQDVRELYRIANGQLSPFDCAPIRITTRKACWQLVRMQRIQLAEPIGS
jgi:cell wall assembly regulator SMI1